MTRITINSKNSGNSSLASPQKASKEINNSSKAKRTTLSEDRTELSILDILTSQIYEMSKRMEEMESLKIEVKNQREQINYLANQNLELSTKLKILETVIEHKVQTTKKPLVAKTPEIDQKGGKLSYAKMVNQPKPIIKDLSEDEVKKILTAPIRKKGTFERLYFKGVPRTTINNIKSLIKYAGIDPIIIRNISFVGADMLELIIFDTGKAQLIEALQKLKIEIVIDFNPLSSDNLKSERFQKMESEEKKKAARDIFIKNQRKILERLPESRGFYNLKTYIQNCISEASGQRAMET